MIKYRNFSLDNIFLLSGYSEESTPDGIIREYKDEAGLEQKVRELVATKKRSLSGWDVRFLRQGMGLSQAQLGAIVERDAQSIARWEKSKDNVPLLADLAIRVHFLALYRPSFSVKEINAIFEEKNQPSASIYLAYSNNHWIELVKPQVYSSAAFSERSSPGVVLTKAVTRLPSHSASKSRLFITSTDVQGDRFRNLIVSSGALTTPDSSVLSDARATNVQRSRPATADFAFKVDGLSGRA